MGLDIKMRLVLSNTFMSLVVVCNLAYYSYLKENDDNHIKGTSLITNIPTTDPDKYSSYLSLSIAAFCLMLVGFLIGMVQPFLKQAALTYVQALLILTGYVCLFAGIFILDSFSYGFKDGEPFNYQVAEFFAIGGVFIQGMVNSWRQRSVS
ncbi:unnamed protein product [Paramecium pentaurelia]|uniref:Uncharacterized protein n=1 Tax=Paramecium pentaurelia TaxID=43138 RepID=A0A8S1V785_9CILI|nr:unnamed protein product [Paramecium pentaurelia]